MTHVFREIPSPEITTDLYPSIVSQCKQRLNIQSQRWIAEDVVFSQLFGSQTCMCAGCIQIH